MPRPSSDPPRANPAGSMASSYWRQSRRPLASLALIVPLLALYEGGVLLLGTQAVRNGADVWLRRLLDWIGFGQYFLLPVLTVCLLLAWHHVNRDRWKLSAGVLYAMYAECAVLGILLLALGHLQSSILQSLANPHLAPSQLFTSALRLNVLGRLIGFFGAGIYEEVLFRLMLLPACIAALKLIGLAPRPRTIAAIVATSLLFSAAHYWGPQGEKLEWFGFVFRFLAGAVFATLFVYRGFGIAAGTHAAYDIFVGLF